MTLDEEDLDIGFRYAAWHDKGELHIHLYDMENERCVLSKPLREAIDDLVDGYSCGPNPNETDADGMKGIETLAGRLEAEAARLRQTWRVRPINTTHPNAPAPTA